MEVIFAKDKIADAATFFLDASPERPVTFQVDGALAADTFTITGAGIDGSTATTLATAMVLSAAAPVITFTYPIRIIITKGTPANNVGLMKLG